MADQGTGATKAGGRVRGVVAAARDAVRRRTSSQVSAAGGRRGGTLTRKLSGARSAPARKVPTTAVTAKKTPTSKVTAGLVVVCAAQSVCWVCTV